MTSCVDVGVRGAGGERAAKASSCAKGITQRLQAFGTPPHDALWARLGHEAVQWRRDLEVARATEA